MQIFLDFYYEDLNEENAYWRKSALHNKELIGLGFSATAMCLCIFVIALQ